MHDMNFAIFAPAMIIGSILFMVLLAVGLVGLILKVLSGGGGGSKRQASNQEEMRVAQEIYNSLQSMEKRIEALETILLDRMRKE